MNRYASSDLNRLHDAVRGLHMPMLTTASEYGLLTSQPLHRLERAAQGRYWSCCGDPQPAAGDVDRYRCVSPAFGDESSHRHVSAACRGEIVRDGARIRTTATPIDPCAQ